MLKPQTAPCIISNGVSIVSCLASRKSHLATFKPIDNRWVWGTCMVKWKGGQLSEPWRYQCIHDNPGSGAHPNQSTDA